MFNVRLIFNTVGIYGDLLSPFWYNGQKFPRNNLTAAFIQRAARFLKVEWHQHALILSPHGFGVLKSLCLDMNRC